LAAELQPIWWPNFSLHDGLISAYMLEYMAKFS